MFCGNKRLETRRTKLSISVLYHAITDLGCVPDPALFPRQLASLKIGRMDGSRWYTTASRAMRLYVTVAAPGHPVLNQLAKFIVSVYFKVHA